jgi:hypothetical protein
LAAKVRTGFAVAIRPTRANGQGSGFSDIVPAPGANAGADVSYGT